MNQLKGQPSFFPKYRAGILAECGALIVCITLTLLLRISILEQFSTHYLGGFSGDGGLYIWLTKHSINEFFSGGFFTTKAFFPYTTTLAWSDNFLLPTFVVNCFEKFGLTHVQSYNLLLLLATALGGFITYRLAFTLSGMWASSVASGLAALSLGYLCYNLGHPQLQFFLFLPLGIKTLFDYLKSFSKWKALLFGVTVLAAFLTTVYFALFLVIVAGSFWLALLTMKKVSLRECLVFTIFALLGVSPILYLLSPYLAVQDIFGSRALYEPYFFAASTMSYIASTPAQILYGSSATFSHSEAYLFSGIALYGVTFITSYKLFAIRKLKKESFFLLALFLAIVVAATSRSFQLLTALLAWAVIGYSLWWFSRFSKLEEKLRVNYITNRTIIAVLLFTALLFFIITLGPLGNVTKHETALGPYRLFYTLLPGFSSLRAISRAGIVPILIFTILIPFVFQKVKRIELRLPLLALLLGIILIENLQHHYPIEAQPRVPEIYKTHAFKESSVVAFLPLTDELRSDSSVKSWSNFAANNVRAMNWAKDLGVYTINGYSGQRTKIMKEWPRKLSGFPDRRSLGTLALLPNLDYVAVKSSKDLKERVKRFPELTHVASDGNGNFLFSFTPKTKITGNNNDFFLRVPSEPIGADLTLELQALFEPQTPTTEVTLHELDHLDNTTIATFTLPADGKKHSFTIQLPERKDRGRPFRIVIRTYKKKTLYLHGRRWNTKNSENQE